MTTEEDFQRALDANPDDWQTRLVFADWLQERGDPRAEGYRAIVSQARRSDFDNKQFWWGNASKFVVSNTPYPESCYLPEDWYLKIDLGPSGIMDSTWFQADTLREAEDAAALAFTKLPAERRAELLNPTESTP